VIGRVFGSQRLVEAVVMRASSHAVAIFPCEGLWGRVSGCFFKRGHIMVPHRKSYTVAAAAWFPSNLSCAIELLMFLFARLLRGASQASSAREAMIKFIC
jgi:hypothetical protein